MKQLNQRPMSSLHFLWPLQRILKYLGRTQPELSESSLIDDVLARIGEITAATIEDPKRSDVDEAL